MRKRYSALILILFLAIISFSSQSALAEELYLTANLHLVSDQWTVQEWGNQVNVVVNGAGEYTLTYYGKISDVQMLCIDIPNGDAVLKATGLGLVDLKIYADGTPVAVDVPRIQVSDPESMGSYYIEVYKAVGSGYSAPIVSSDRLACEEELKIVFTIGKMQGSVGPSEIPTEPTTTPTPTTEAEGDLPPVLQIQQQSQWLVPVLVFSAGGIAAVSAAIVYILRKKK